jgi:Flp pilus assembly protein CpaB
MLAAGLLGAVGMLAALRAADARVEVLVAAHDLRTGDRVEADDLRTGRLAADDALLRSFTPASQRDALIGLVVVSPVAAGAPVLDDALRSGAAPDEGRAMSFSVSADRAVSGAIDLGDRIDVLAVDRDGTVRYALVDTLVLDRSAASDRAPIRGSGPDELTLTVAVDATGAGRLAAALADGEITVVRATGAARLDAVEWYRATGEVDGEVADRA